MKFLDLSIQQNDCRAELDRRFASVLAHGQYIMGPEVAEMESVLADYVGTAHCVSVSSGTEALLIALMALDIGRGDEVVTSPFTFAATAEVIALLGATPVFVDVDPLTANLDAALLEASITEHTKAIIPVSLFGQTCDMDAINAIAARYGQIPVIEDGAQSFGASFRGVKSSGLSTIGTTSFFPSKPLGCYGDGGALFTNDPTIAQAAREIRVHGQSGRYHHTRIGVGGRMDTLQCAVILAKWPRFGVEVERREELGRRYTRLIHQAHPNCQILTRQEAVAGFQGVRTIAEIAGGSHVYGQYTILVADRDALAEHMKSCDIPTAIHYPQPLNAQPAYAAFGDPADTPWASWLSRHVLSLPMGPDLTFPEQNQVVAAIAEWLRRNDGATSEPALAGSVAANTVI